MSEENTGTTTEATESTGGDWTAGLDNDMREYVTTKGYKSPGDVIRAYSNLESKIGTDKVPLPPKGEDGSRDFSEWEGWREIGVPEAPEYTFNAPEGVEFNDTDKAFQAHMAPAMHEAKLSQWQVDKLSEALNSFSGQMAQQSEEGREASFNEAQAGLRKELGKAYDETLDQANRFVRDHDLKEVLAKYGADNEPALVKAFAAAARASGEDGSLPGDKGGSFRGTPTPAAAQAEIDRIYGEASRNKAHPLNNPEDSEHEAVNDRLMSLFAAANPEETE